MTETTQHLRTRFSLALIGALSIAALLAGCDSSKETESPAEPAPAESPVSPNPQESEPAATEGQPSAQTGPSTEVQSSSEQQVALADQLLESGKTNEAAAILTKLLIADPGNAEVVFRLANLKASTGNLDEAIEVLESIPPDDPIGGLPALGQAADWCMQAQRYAEAEQKYRKILEAVPEASMAHRQLAYLFNRQGRRHEACQHIRELCKLGDVRQDELQSLIVVSDAMMPNPEPVDPNALDYQPIGVSGQARILFTQKRYAEAASILRDPVAKGELPPAINALYGRALAEAQEDAAFEQWVTQVDDSVREFSEYWAALAAHLAGRQETESAIRASLESLDRDPTDFTVINRLLTLFKVLDRRDDYARWEERWKALHNILTSNNKISAVATPQVDEIDEVAAQLFALDRKLEAVIWKWLEAYYRKLPQETLNHWSNQRLQLVNAKQSFPTQASRLCGMSLDAYPLPDFQVAFRSSAVATKPQRTLQQAAAVSLRNIADQIGLDHAYQVASEQQDDGFAMYQQTGGGIAVIDFDLNGHPDLYFAQGAADPPAFTATQSDVLFRSVDGSLVNVTIPAGVSDAAYTIGCSSGDWNQDGLPDIATTSIGRTELLINNGDGSFSRQTLDESNDLTRMPASIAIADLNRDRIPDLIELNYIKDTKLATKPNRDPSGAVIDAVGPADFSAGVDRIAFNDGRGLAQLRPISEEPSESHQGLGVVIADFDGKPGNEVFVGNDKAPNQMWLYDDAADSWTNIAVATGTAYSFGGASTASMGIASSDFDANGQLDLLITNFQNESVCLYLNRDGVFRDLATKYKLDVPSRGTLGFGSQSFDYDNNGLPDVAVCNGHIDKYQSMSGPFEQPPQLFANLGDRFEQVAVTDPSGYWETPQLGRSMARLDFNLDGKEDLAISHIGKRSALLLNETPSENHWLQLELVGVTSERDAIGAEITIRLDDTQLVHWVVGGDGYLARNEAVVPVGLGAVASVDQIDIRWPGGSVQTLENVPADRRLLVVEQQPGWFERSPETP